MLNNPCDMATVKSIAKLGCTTGKAIIAESVPSKAVVEYLSGIGVQYAQGHYFSEPSPLTFNSIGPVAEELSYPDSKVA